MSTQSNEATMITTASAIVAPVTGQILPLAAVPDPVFSSGALGRGLAIRPSDTKFFAPISGEIVTAMPHAYGIRSDDGIEVLVHIGLDTVELDGAHFASAVTTGQRVAAGELLAEVDLDAVTAAGFETITVVVVPNTATLASVILTGETSTVTGATIITASV